MSISVPPGLLLLSRPRLASDTPLAPRMTLRIPYLGCRPMMRGEFLAAAMRLALV